MFEELEWAGTRDMPNRKWRWRKVSKMDKRKYGYLSKPGCPMFKKVVSIINVDYGKMGFRFLQYRLKYIL